MNKIFRWIKTLIKLVVAIIIILVIAIFSYFKWAPQLGGDIEGTRKERIAKSTHNKKGKFVNLVQTDMSMPPASAMWEAMTGADKKDPQHQISTKPFDKQHYGVNVDSSYRMTWFGHSSVLLQLDGKNFLIDPVFSKRASMFSFMGPKRYDYSNHVTVDDMPELDAVFISHDHYDHLDYETFQQLKQRVNKFYVPLGVGAHLERWGIPVDQIEELDWWNETSHDTIKLAFVPSRHFSGRGIRDRFNTLWGAWVFQGSAQKLFFGGDSGYFDGFKEIGQKYGPFDFAMLECGQYSKYWPDIHMMPEQTAQAGADLQAQTVMPIHWGKFTLSIHNWKEPVTRFLKASNQYNYNVLVPELNTTILVPDSTSISDWWKSTE